MFWYVNNTGDVRRLNATIVAFIVTIYRTR